VEGFLLNTTAIDPGKIASYRAAHYRVGAGGTHFTLLIGQPSPELRDLYHATKTDSALFITAFNPFGAVQSMDANLLAHARLGDHLRALTAQTYEGHGADPTGEWPPESSYLALGIDKDTAERLGRRAHQDAVVWADADSVPQLLLLR